MTPIGTSRPPLPATTLVAPANGPWLRRALAWSGWCLPMVPLTILLHELGHLVAAAALGFPDIALHFSSVSHGDVADRPAWAAAAVGFAGPMVTVVMTLFAVGWITLRTKARWAFALAIASASRFAVGVPYTAASLIVSLSGRRLAAPAFDEHKAATAVGWSGDAVLASTAVFLIATLVWIAYELPRGERSAAWPGLIAGTGVGWALWMGVVGRVLLP